MENIKSYDNYKEESGQAEVNESIWSSIFGKPTVKDAAHTSLRGQGYSHIGKEDDQNYIMFNGQKFYPNQIEYADYQDLGELPRVENGKLLIANPAWSM